MSKRTSDPPFVMPPKVSDAPPLRPFPPLPPAPTSDDEEDRTRISPFPTLWEAPSPSAAGGARPTQAGAKAPTAGAAHQQPPAATRAADASVGRSAASTNPSSWLTKLLQAPFVGRREKKQVARTSRELLALHHTVAAQYPASKGRALYRRIVAARRGIELSEADAILRRANDSFAKWPVERPLIFRDVVHYLALSDYLASNDSANWARENLGREVARFIPEDL